MPSGKSPREERPVVSGKPADGWLDTLLGSFKSMLVQGSSAGVEAGPWHSSTPEASGAFLLSAGQAFSKVSSVLPRVSGPLDKLPLRLLELSTDSLGRTCSGSCLSTSEEASVSLGADSVPLPLTSSPKKQPALRRLDELPECDRSLSRPTMMGFHVFPLSSLGVTPCRKYTARSSQLMPQTWSFSPTFTIVISPTISIQLVPQGL